MWQSWMKCEKNAPDPSLTNLKTGLGHMTRAGFFYFILHYVMKFLRPFFSYYGGKWRAAPHYGQPLHNTIIEPFAGGAGYSCRFYTRNVILYDADPTIAGLWDYLIHVNAEEIMSLPLDITHLDQMNLTQEQKWLIGFWISKAGVVPKKSPSKWARDKVGLYWEERTRDRIARQVPLIKHWQIRNESYINAPDQDATWFIDPPYNNAAGQIYNTKFTDFANLADWCRTRTGQVIVCEQEGASWLPFQTFKTIQTTHGKRGKSKSAEVVWYNNQDNST